MATFIINKCITWQHQRKFSISETFYLAKLFVLMVSLEKVVEAIKLPGRYAAPEQYIMSTQTPSAPSVPVATTLSPVLWQVSFELIFLFMFLR